MVTSTPKKKMEFQQLRKEKATDRSSISKTPGKRKKNQISMKPKVRDKPKLVV